MQLGHVNLTLDRGEQLSPVRVTAQQDQSCHVGGEKTHLLSPGIDRPKDWVQHPCYHIAVFQ